MLIMYVYCLNQFFKAKELRVSRYVIITGYARTADSQTPLSTRLLEVVREVFKDVRLITRIKRVAYKLFQT
jgi:hypothetical protein